MPRSIPDDESFVSYAESYTDSLFSKTASEAESSSETYDCWDPSYDEREGYSRSADRVRRWAEETQDTFSPDTDDDAMEIDPPPTNSRRKPRPLGSEETIRVESHHRIRNYKDSLLIGKLVPRIHKGTIDEDESSILLYRNTEGEIKIGRSEDQCQVVILDPRISE